MVRTPEIKVAVRTAGSSGPAVVLLHGNLSSSIFWQSTMATLAGEFRCLAPDLRGYGDTEPLPVRARTGLDDMAGDVLAAIDELGIELFHLIGHSMGGGVAMKMLLRRPEALSSMTLVDSISPFGYSGSALPTATRPSKNRSVSPDLKRAMGRLKSPCSVSTSKRVPPPVRTRSNKPGLKTFTGVPVTGWGFSGGCPKLGPCHDSSSHESGLITSEGRGRRLVSDSTVPPTAETRPCQSPAAEVSAGGNHLDPCVGETVAGASSPIPSSMRSVTSDGSSNGAAARMQDPAKNIEARLLRQQRNIAPSISAGDRRGRHAPALSRSWICAVRGDWDGDDALQDGADPVDGLGRGRERLGLVLRRMR